MTQMETVNPKVKDTLFRMLFSEKEELLSLYNAVRGTNYTNPEELEVNTLEDVIYLSMKNDISFVIRGNLSLYEHQSTWNSNMPLRSLFYIANLYSGITADENLYGSKQLRLPTPHFIVFYNGEKRLEDRTVQKLSESYEVVENEVNLELIVITLNINKGHNQELMDKCKTLREYACYIETVREYKRCMSIEEAVKKAIETCINNDILAEFLRTYRAEVTHVSIFEYDAEKHLAQEKAESREEGLEQGLEQGKQIEKMSLIRKMLLKDMKIQDIAEFLEVEENHVKNIETLIKEHPMKTDVELVGIFANM